MASYLFTDVNRASAKKNDNNVIAYVADCLCKLLLSCGEEERTLVTAGCVIVIKARVLALNRSVKTECKNCDIRFGGCCNAVAYHILESAPMIKILVTIITSLFNLDFGILENSSDTVGDGHVFGCIAVVIAFKGGDGKGVGTDNRNFLVYVFVKRKEVIFIFKQYHTLLRCFQIKCLMLVAVKLIVSDIGIRSRVFKFTQTVADGEEIFCGGSDVLIGY